MKTLLLFSLILVGSLFVLSGGGRTNDQPIENPPATNNTAASPSITVAAAEKTKICHFDVSGASKVIIVGNRALPDHFGHGDCLSILPKGTVDCTCAPPPEITSFTADGPCASQPPTGVTLSWTTSNATSVSLLYTQVSPGFPCSGGCNSGPRTANGSEALNTLFPTLGIVQCDDTIMLTATGPGGSAMQTITPQ